MALTPFIQRFWGFSDTFALRRAKRRAEQEVLADQKRQELMLDALRKNGQLLESLEKGGTLNLRAANELIRATKKTLKNVEAEYGIEIMLPDHLQEKDPERTNQITALYTYCIPAARAYNQCIEQAVGHLRSLTEQTPRDEAIRTLRHVQDHLQHAEDEDARLIQKERELAAVHEAWHQSIAQKH